MQRVLGVAKQAPSKVAHLQPYMWSIKQFMFHAPKEQIQISQQQYAKLLRDTPIVSSNCVKWLDCMN